LTVVDRYLIILHLTFQTRLINATQPSMSITVTPEQLSALRSTLLNTSGSTPLHERFRALFMLKAVGGDEVITIISEGTSMSGYSVLLPAPPTQHLPTPMSPAYLCQQLSLACSSLQQPSTY
jgi:hypothetical protein